MSIKKKKIIFVFFLLFLVNIFTIYEKNRLEKAIKSVDFDIEVLEWQEKKIKAEVSGDEVEIERMKYEWQDLLFQKDFLESSSLKIKQDIDTMQEEIEKIEKR